LKIKEFIKAKISEYTGKRNAKEEQYFFYGQIKNSPSHNISIVKPPYTYFCKPDVPTNKNESHYKCRFKKSTKISAEFNLVMKRKNKTNYDCQKIY